MAESKSAALPLGYAPTRPGAPRIAVAAGQFNETLHRAATVPRLHLAVAAAEMAPGGVLGTCPLVTHRAVTEFADSSLFDRFN